MTPAEFKAIRVGLGLTQNQLADKMGYRNVRTVQRYESGEKDPIPPYIAQLMIHYRDCEAKRG